MLLQLINDEHLQSLFSAGNQVREDKNTLNP